MKYAFSRNSHRRNWEKVGVCYCCGCFFFVRMIWIPVSVLFQFVCVVFTNILVAVIPTKYFCPSIFSIIIELCIVSKKSISWQSDSFKIIAWVFTYQWRKMLAPVTLPSPIRTPNKYWEDLLLHFLLEASLLGHRMLTIFSLPVASRDPPFRNSSWQLQWERPLEGIPKKCISNLFKEKKNGKVEPVIATQSWYRKIHS